MLVKNEMSEIFNQLSRESQCYILNMANMARIAERSVSKSKKKNKK